MPADDVVSDSPPAVAARVRAEVRRGVVGILSLRVVSIALEFSLSLVLARLLQAAQFGVYSYVIAWIAILSIPAALGLDRLTTREAAALKASADWQQLRGLLQSTGLIVAAFSVALAGFACIVALWGDAAASDPLVRCVRIGLAALPLAAFARLRCAALQGLGHTVLAQVPESLLLPSTILTLAAVLFHGVGLPGSAEWAVCAYVAGMAVACLVAVALLRARLPREISHARPSFRTMHWIRQAIPFIFIVGLTALMTNIDIVMLGMLDRPASSGIYRVTGQVAALVALPLWATNAAIAPRIAATYAMGRVDDLQDVILWVARRTFVVALAIACVLSVFGRLILAAFGPDFPTGYAPLLILLVGQLFGVAAGSVGYLLVMTGHMRDAAVGFAGAAALNALLNAWLIPLFGMSGAAVASTATLVGLNIRFAMLVRKRLGLRTTLLP